ncbi:hypothetical protein TRIATDRAFT_158690 [Trichoderma atroviride IMI 206040]|uniref:Uncharacterized protein n=1 Tax=Hypocrea atroviridis (strain ATCC 20476 / IMI 206040) TaxID=452589 RepID=G9P476_HYPAI|nr:uncharacterized protein TRIATDRAFT_158690 [Trichoderma atroviride IMI 206040]EHK41920.1 hypothetical protein TRIATDRAFT_158690 [Trichoderma atroviride IMI 206040]
MASSRPANQTQWAGHLSGFDAARASLSGVLCIAQAPRPFVSYRYSALATVATGQSEVFQPSPASA